MQSFQYSVSAVEAVAHSPKILTFVGMAGNTFGQHFRITTFGESHGPAVGVVVDGCPAGIRVDHDLLKRELARRRPGQSAITSQRRETEKYELLSGIFEGETTGTPITVLLPNKDARPSDYAHLKAAYRPSHADFTYDQKYGHRDYRGGGRASARETAARVAGGAFARMLLQQAGIRIQGFVTQVGTVRLEEVPDMPKAEAVEANAVRCPDEAVAQKMIQHIKEVRKAGDTTGGVVRCVVQGAPPGLGEPVFDKLEAGLAKAMLSINASKGFEIGSGFRGVAMRGSEHNDRFVCKGKRIVTETNYSGGIQGGITNGMDIWFNVAFKPVSTLMQDQQTVNRKGQAVTIKGKGRHDPCVVPRAVPVVEGMAAVVLADHWLRGRAYR